MAELHGRAEQPNKRKRDTRWIVIDAEGEVHARVEALTRDVAERMAFVMFPELEGTGKVLGWYEAGSNQRCAAKQALLITPALLARRFASAGGAR